jgi:hypothetical protein
MTELSMCFADLSSADEFDSNEHSCARSKRYVKLSVTFQNGIGHYANAVEMETGDPALFEPEDRVTLIRQASELRDSYHHEQRPAPAQATS